MNVILRSVISVGKILILFALAYFFVGLFFTKSTTQLAIGFFVLIFITLPTIFIMFLKKKFIAKHQKLITVWKIVRIIYIISIVLFILGLAVGEYRNYERDKTNKAIEFINSKKITMVDVMGSNLPPVPNKKLNDSTVAGIDANKNYIRDDVELAIFKKYPNSAKIRAAELQYAQALQLELTQVFNSGTLINVMQQEDLASFCSAGIMGINDATIKEKEVEDLVLNTNLRKKEESNVYEKYMIGYTLPSGSGCEIDPSFLSN